MTDRILTACPHCHHELRVRSEYAGLKLVCKYCHKTFEAQLPGAPGKKPPRVPGTTDQELERARAKIARLRGQRQVLTDEVLKAKNVLGPLRHRVKDLDDQLDQARAQAALAEEEVRASAVALAELDRLRVELATLGPQAADAMRLEARLADAGHENDRLRSELEETRVLLSRASDAFASTITPAAEPPSDEHALEIARLEIERDEAARQRDQLQRELESVRTGFKEARDEINRMGRGLEEIAAESARLEDERAAVSRMRDQFQSLIDEQRRSHADREAQLNMLREHFDLERAELESQFGQEERRLAALYAEAQAGYEERIRWLEAELERNVCQMQARETNEDLARQLESARGEIAALKDSLAAGRKAIASLRLDYDEVAALHQQVHERALQTEQRLRAEIDRLACGRSEALSQLEVKSRLIADLTRRLKSLQDEIAQAPRLPAMNGGGLPARPQSTNDEQPAAFRTRLHAWLDRANGEFTAMTGRAEALGAELKAAREELDLLDTDLALGAWTEDKIEIAFPFEEG